jgi:hypothetical protein
MSAAKSARSLIIFIASALVILIVPLLCAAILSLPYQAKAEPLDYIQLTCSPELNYFTARTITLDSDSSTLEDLETDEGAKQLIEERDGMHSIPGDIDKHPYICKLPRRTITAEITNYFPGGDHMACGSLDHFDVLIKVDGTEVDEFSAFGNRCAGPETHLVEFDVRGLTDCTLPYLGNSSATVLCSTTRKSELPNQKNSPKR